MMFTLMAFILSITIVIFLFNISPNFIPVIEIMLLMYFFYRHYIMTNKINMCMENGMTEIECITHSIDITDYILL